MNFLKDKFTKNTLTLMVGTILSQAIPFAISPILTRIYSPEEFGIFGLYFSISMIFSVFISGRYEMAIILPEKHEDALNLLGLSIIITIIISFLSAIIIILFKSEIATILNAPLIANQLWIMPLTIFCIGIYQSFGYWLNRFEQYSFLSTSRVIRSLFTSGFSISFPYIFLKRSGLILGDTLGQLFSSIYVYRKSIQSNNLKWNIITKRKMREQAIRYKQFPIFNVISGVLEKGSAQFSVIIFTSLFGEAISGFFTFSQRIIAAPGAIVAKAIGDVFRQQASVEYIKNGNCEKIFMKMFWILFSLSLIPFTILFFYAPEIFKVIFGEKWEAAGKYAQIMTVMFFLQFVVSPLSSMFLIAEKQKTDLFIQFVLFISITTSILAGYNIFKKPEIIVSIFTAIYSVKYIFEFLLSHKFSKGLNN